MFFLVMPDNIPPLSVMVIDDDDISIYLVQKTIASAGFSTHVTTYNDANSALNYLLENKDIKDNLPNIILLDINMPITSGWKFLDIFSSYNFVNRPAVYMLSSSDSVVDKMKSTKYPGIVKGYFNKPLKKENLYALMQYYC